MAMILLCSASGSPGVTVTGLGLALTWPDEVLLVDADSNPAQAIPAGYLRGQSMHGLGLPALLRVHREHGAVADALERGSLPLPEPPPRPPADTIVSRRFLPGFTHPAVVELFDGVWRDLGRALAQAPGNVLVDAGRIGPRGLPAGLLDAAAQVAVVCRSSLVSLAAVHLYLPLLLDHVDPGRVGLIVVGPGRPYRSAEVAEQFGVPALAEIGWEPSGAGDLHDGQPLSPRWRGHALARSYAAAARALSASLSERVAAPA